MSKKIEEIILKVSVDDSKATAKINNYSSAAEIADRKTKDLTGSSLKLKAALAATALTAVKVVKEAGQVALKYDKINNSLKTVTGSAGAANEEMAFLNEISDDLGIRVTSLAGDYTKLFAAMKGAGLAKEDTRELAKGVAELSTAMGLASEDTAGITKAIAQIAAKGKLSAEELHQLGDRGVDAFGLASRAIGVTTKEMSKMLEQGEIISDDFLPKFAQQMRKEFADPAKQASNSAQANINRLKNEWERSIQGMGDAMLKFVPILTSGIEKINDLFSSLKDVAKEVNAVTDALLGVASSSDGDNPEARRLIAQGKLNREKKKTQELEKAEKEEIDKLAESIKRLDSINQLGIKFLNIENLQNIRNELSLTTQEFDNLSPAIMEALNKGANTEEIINSLKSFIPAFKEELNKISEDVNPIKGPFDDLIRKSQDLKAALDMKKVLKLNNEEFEKIGETALALASTSELSTKQLKNQVEKLRDLGFFANEKKKEKSISSPSGPIQTLFEKGASATAFLNDRSVEFEHQKINYLRELVEQGKMKSKDALQIIAG